LIPIRKKTSVPFIGDSLSTESCLPLNSHYSPCPKYQTNTTNYTQCICKFWGHWYIGNGSTHIFHVPPQSSRKQGIIIHDCQYGSRFRL